MDVQLAEIAPQRLLAVEIDLLVAEEQHLVLASAACSASTSWLDSVRVRSMPLISAPILGVTCLTVNGMSDIRTVSRGKGRPICTKRHPGRTIPAWA